MKAVILAGGKGRRLQPFTTTVPKPLFPIGDKPVLQIVIEKLKSNGINEFIVSLGFLGGLIEAFFGDGSKFGCSITYVNEGEPLGTAGPLSLLPKMDDDFLLMNGDVLTTLDFNKAIEFHKSNNNFLTICTFKKKIKSSLGIIKVNEDNDVTDYLEKPETEYLVSSGIYVMNPDVAGFVNQNERLDLPQLVLRLLENKKRVKSFEIEGKWFDIGTPADLELALEMYDNNKL